MKHHNKSKIAVYNGSNNILSEIRTLIESARGRVAASVNTELTLLYWHIGKRINKEILGGKRADYGNRVVLALSSELTRTYGKGFDDKNLWRMVQFFESFSREAIVVTLSRQLTWSHFTAILPVRDSLARDFYAEMCRIERWSVRILREKIDGMLFERTALSKKPERTIKQEIVKIRKEDTLTPDMVFKDPYFLDFLGLKDRYAEKDIEDAILREMESFLLELGAGFTFIARQKRITVDGDDYYIDLLFFHRGINRLVVIELKLGNFKPAYKGQMELYLRWLEKYEKKPGENAPVGIILCAGKKEETIELLQMEKSGIKVAAYMTELPPKKLLEKKLHESIQKARLKHK
jgi:predicted nuclease of restriction endonuclease-like (RecB) superfamily